MSLIVEIIAYFVFEVVVLLGLWVLALVLWAIALPLSCIAAFPLFVIMSAFASEPFAPSLSAKYRGLLDWWMKVKSRILDLGSSTQERRARREKWERRQKDGGGTSGGVG